MNEESTKEESVRVQWTFDEAAAIAEHLKERPGDRPLPVHARRLDRRGLRLPPSRQPARQSRVRRQRSPGRRDPPHPSPGLRRLPPRQLPGHVPRRQELEPRLHREAARRLARSRAGGGSAAGPSWSAPPSRSSWPCDRRTSPESRSSSARGATSSTRPTPSGPRECADPNHPIGRNDDIAWKIKLSDESRKLFGLFGSECGREWALPHSDFFEGLVGVSGKYFHNLKPESLGAKVIPFWEMVYHDCEICYGKYGYSANQAGGVRGSSRPLRPPAPLSLHPRPPLLAPDRGGQARKGKGRGQRAEGGAQTPEQSRRGPASRAATAAGPRACTRPTSF